MKDKKQKWLSPDQIYQKISAYCAYQERCHSEVRNKLIKLGCFGDDLEEQIIRLIEENFLNEERYAILYAQSKLRQSHWGRIKIDINLRAKDVSEYCRKKALNALDDFEYNSTLRKILESKWNSITSYKSTFDRKMKTQQHAFRKGFEPELITNLLESLLNSDSLS